jgi:hypothetical protein
MLPEDDGTTDGCRDPRPYSILLIACVLAAGKLAARFVSHVAREVFVVRGPASQLGAAYSRGLQGSAS